MFGSLFLEGKHHLCCASDSQLIKRYLKKSNREKLRMLSPLTSEELRVFDGLLAACGHHKRGPCMIAIMMGKTCVEVSYIYQILFLFVTNH